MLIEGASHHRRRDALHHPGTTSDLRDKIARVEIPPGAASVEHGVCEGAVEGIVEFADEVGKDRPPRRRPQHRGWWWTRDRDARGAGNGEVHQQIRVTGVLDSTDRPGTGWRGRHVNHEPPGFVLSLRLRSSDDARLQAEPGAGFGRDRQAVADLLIDSGCGPSSTTKRRRHR